VQGGGIQSSSVDRIIFILSSAKSPLRHVFKNLVTGRGRGPKGEEASPRRKSKTKGMEMCAVEKIKKERAVDACVLIIP